MKKIFALVLAIAGLPGTMRGQQGYRPDTRTPDEVRRAMAATPPADRLAAGLRRAYGSLPCRAGGRIIPHIRSVKFGYEPSEDAARAAAGIRELSAHLID